VFSAFVVKAQVGYNYKEFSIGLDVSYERGYTNLNRQDQHFGESINFTYNYSPYIPITAELQFGTLSGGGLTQNLDKYGRMYTNHFEGLILHGDFQLGEVVDYTESYFMSAIKGFYIGSGGGIIFNSNTVQRTNVILSNGPSTYVFPGSNSSINLTIPLRIGYEFKLFNEYEEPWMAINIGYVHNLVFGEGLDGYDDPSSKFKNNATNQYRQIVVGVRFNFGNVTSYNKVIRQL
jgi:hypothetical protein